MFCLPQYLSWSLIVLCLFQHTSHCTSPPLLQSHWRSGGLSSNLLPRAPYDGGDLMNFDDMPDCAKKGCLPLDPSTVGCSINMTKDCYCSNNSQWSCASGGNCVQTLFWQWLAHVCLAIPLDSFDQIPTCARACIKQGGIYGSCSLRSWDCFCATDLPKDCLVTCTTKDKDAMAAWKTEHCATYDSGPAPGTESTTSARFTSTTSTKSTSTTTLGTQRATEAVTLATPNSTVRVPGATIAPAPVNGSAQQWLPSAAV